MILERRKIKHGSQEEIGYELGLVVPIEKAHLFARARTGKKPVAGYGTQVGKKRYSINSYFSKNNIKLKEKYFYPGNAKNVKRFINENLKGGNDMIACFNNKKLYGKGDWGHVSLVQGINKDTVTLIDPAKGARKASLTKLVKAMKHHWRKRRGGFWLISEYPINS